MTNVKIIPLLNHTDVKVFALQTTLRHSKTIYMFQCRKIQLIISDYTELSANTTSKRLCGVESMNVNRKKRHLDVKFCCSGVAQVCFK